MRRSLTALTTIGPRLLQGAGVAAVVAIPLALLLALVRTQWGPLRAVDRGTAADLTARVRSHATMVHLLDGVAVGLSPTTFYVASALLAVVLWRKRMHRLSAWVVVTAATGSLLGVVLKLVVSRARPLIAEPVAHANGYSFPSGHALNSFLGCGILLLTFLPALQGARRWIAASAATLVVLAVGLDRIALGVHYVSDVLAGWAVAAATLAGTVTGFEVWRREHGLRPSAPSEGVEPESAPELSHPAP